MGDSGEYSRGSSIGHRLFMTILNRGASLRGLEAMRDRAAEAFTAGPRSPDEQALFRGFGDTFGVYLDDLRELEETASTSPLGIGCAGAGPPTAPGAQGGPGHPEMEAGA